MDDKCIIRWDEVSANSWGSYLNKAPFAAYQQHYAYGEVIKRFGTKAMRAVIEWDGEVVGLAQFASRKMLKAVTVILALRGPVWIADIDDEAKSICYDKLKNSVARRFPSFVFLAPEGDDVEALKATKLGRMTTGYSTVIIDLLKSEDQLLGEMDGKWRNRLKAAQKNDVIIKIVSPKPGKYDWLLEKEEEQASRVGYKRIGPEVVKMFQAAEGRESILTLRAEYQGGTAGGVMILVHGNNATYHIGWSNDAGKKYGAHNLLLWEAVRKLKARGIKALDLGGVNTEPSGAGIARFKLGLCNNLVQLPGTYM